MKKCASCTKDLPEAALHCVFCGAKQPPVPAVQPGLAKTAFGYSASELIDQGKAAAPAYPPPRPQPGSHPPPHMQATIAERSYSPPAAGSGLAQNPAASAATVFAPPQPAPYAPSQPQQPPPYTPPSPSGGMGVQSARQITPQPLPVVVNDPYLSRPQTSAARPIEPWRDSLRVVMFGWGAITLLAFATPLSTDPLLFNWDAIIHGEGLAKLTPLIVAAVGVLSLVLAGIPMVPLPRGILAALLGLAGYLVPVFVVGVPPWQALVAIAGMITLVPGLLARHEYVESMFPRLLVTIGVICTLLPFLIPNGGEIPLVSLFKGLLDAPGSAKLGPGLVVGFVAIAVVSLLVWMPGPATAGAKVLAWLVILWPTLISHVVEVVVKGSLGDAIKAAPFDTVMKWAPGAAFLALVGYGLATVFGKRLE